MREIFRSAVLWILIILAVIVGVFSAIAAIDGMFYPDLSKRLLGLDPDQISDANPIAVVLLLVLFALENYLRNGFRRKK